MLKEITYFALLLAVVSMAALQRLSVGVPRIAALGKAASEASLHTEPTLPNQAPAPFGKYTENINGVSLELIRAPTGTFLMGNDRSPNPEEKPAHQVNVKSFFIGQYEITRQQWNIVATTLPRINRSLRQQYLGPVQAGAGYYGDTTPADELSSEEAVEFCDRLTRYTGKKYRLASEAEWEYACRAGTQTEYSFGDQFNPAFANMVFVSDFLLRVGELGYANAWGLYDMHGNVSEWCLDHEHANYVGAPSDGSAWTQGGDDRGRGLRGGRYRFKAETGRSSARAFYPKNLSATGFGLRVVAEVTPSIGDGKVTVTSAASYGGISLAPDSIAALFGGNLSDDTQAATTQPLPITLAGASVVIKDSRGNEYAPPLFFASPGQINFQIPSSLAVGPGMVSVVTNGDIHSTGALEIANVSPGLFTADASGRGLAAALVLRVKSNGEQVYEPIAQFDPASGRFVAAPIDLSYPAEQVFLLLFGTGMRNRSSLDSVVASIGDVGTEVLFVGAQGGFAGLDQCNLRLPNTLAGRGEVDVVLTVDGKASNSAKVKIK